MADPTNFSFSARYTEFEIPGALGLLDHGLSGESDMGQTWRDGREGSRRSAGGGRKTKRSCEK